MKKNIVHLSSVDSTNKYALKLIENGRCEEGMVIVAGEQTAGKGHAENYWESEKGKNLTFSLILQPLFIDPAKQFLITQIVSVAILRFLQKMLPTGIVRIKWPNDIYVQDKKIAGILIQNTIRGQNLDYSIIGIGLNVNQEVFQSDAPNPVSLITFTGKQHKLDELLDRLFVEITTLYSNSASADFVESLNNSYLENLYRFNKFSDFMADGKEFKGKIVGIGEYGNLQLEQKNGQVTEYDFKEIKFL